jgi:WD40 repeat protein
MTGHSSPVRAVAAEPDLDGRTLLATGGSDGTVRLWIRPPAPPSASR